MEEERPLPPGKPPHWPGDQPGQKGSFTASEEHAAACLWQHKRSVLPPDTPQPDMRVHWSCQGRALELRLQISEVGRGLGLALWDRLKGWNPVWLHLGVYDYPSTAGRYRKGWTCLKTRVATNQKHTFTHTHTHTHTHKEGNYNTKENHQTTAGKRKGQRRNINQQGDFPGGPVA